MSTTVPNHEFNAGTELGTGETGPEFVVFTKDPFSGMPLPLTGLLSVQGTAGAGGALVLQVFIGGQWVSHPQIVAVPPFIRQMILGNSAATSIAARSSFTATKYRFIVQAGDGTTSLTATIIPSRVELRLV